jgi:hypothetical protein
LRAPAYRLAVVVALRRRGDQFPVSLRDASPQPGRRAAARGNAQGLAEVIVGQQLRTLRFPPSWLS